MRGGSDGRGWGGRGGGGGGVILDIRKELKDLERSFYQLLMSTYWVKDLFDYFLLHYPLY